MEEGAVASLHTHNARRNEPVLKATWPEGWAIGEYRVRKESTLTYRGSDCLMERNFFQYILTCLNIYTECLLAFLDVYFTVGGIGDEPGLF